ncbi:Putative SANT/Myb domain-containing protein [Colletotrichum destructivum]|uniref:SANT/Myb domain-containing protein n=1 Tax=Colletotrichum destructivum TaxID=34406 RepID=A0AAX4I4G2_9PEZI|nr:Putative SANT/Myb domain-containing protein [Colletotrichum destructivum]
MLMPSAFSCDTSQPPLTRLQASLFASPPASPPSLSNPGFGNIFDTCRSLQALLSTPQHQPIAAPTYDAQQYSLPTPAQLPTPPLAHAPPPLKLRLRSRAKQDGGGVNSDHLARKRIAKRAAPRGVNKRRRAADDDTDGDVESDLDISSRRQSISEDQNRINSQVPSSPSTPKRARIAPEAIPLGLERSDYHTLHLLNGGESTNMKNTEETQGSSVEVEADGEPWSAEEDRILVELVLEKLKLSKTEWQDCARSLGKDRNCLSRRWKSLMLQGDVGLKSRRTKLHGTW